MVVFPSSINIIDLVGSTDHYFNIILLESLEDGDQVRRVKSMTSNLIIIVGKIKIQISFDNHIFVIFVLKIFQKNIWIY